MRTLGLALLACLVLSPAARADNADKILGTWEIVKSDSLPPGVTAYLEFTKDGKLKMTVTLKDKDGKDKTVNAEGTYKVDGESIKTKVMDKEETIKIKTLTADKLITVDDKGKSDEFKRKKK